MRGLAANLACHGVSHAPTSTLWTQVEDERDMAGLTTVSLRGSQDRSCQWNRMALLDLIVPGHDF